MTIARRPLGNTGVDVTALGLGGAGVLMDRGVVADDAAAAGVVRFALDRGVRVFDTSPVYGTDADPRRSERRLGMGLGSGGAAFVATKAGLRRNGGGLATALDGDEVRASVAESLRKLGRPTVDLVQIHELTADTWEAACGALAALRELRDEGVVRLVGVTGSDPAILERAIDVEGVDTIQVWRAWNLLDRSAEGLLDAARSAGVGVFVGAPFASGVLAGEDGEFNYGPVPDEIRGRVATIRSIVAERGMSLREAALRFCLDERVGAVLVGARTRQDVAELLATPMEPLPADLVAELA